VPGVRDIHQTVRENFIKAINLMHTLSILRIFLILGGGIHTLDIFSSLDILAMQKNLLVSVVYWVDVTVDNTISCLK